MFSRALLASLLPLASAHFQLQWPAARGFDDTNSVNYPCGGFDTPSSTRQNLPINGSFPIQLNMEHTGVTGMVVLALGATPTGDDYTIVLKPVFQQTGPEAFCIGDVMIPSDLNITDGTQGTIQVVTNGDPSGGLYQCADVTFTSAPLSQSDYDSNCRNSTGVSASFTDASPLPNGTASSTEPAASGSASASDAATSATSSAGGARQTVGAVLLGAAGLLGMAAL